MEDKEKSKPQLELEGVVSTGQFNDDNYVVSKEGHAIWCTGESLLVTGGEGKKYIVKGIINMQAKKQLNLFLMEANDLLERVFIAGKNIPMMILDGSMKIQKVNNAFLDLFEITESPLGGSRVSELNHPFWSNEDLKNDLRLIIINNKPFRDKKFILQTKSGEKKTIKIDSKIIESEPLTGRKIFLLIEEVAYIKPMNVETK
jgi:PAS domain-containing protein